MMDENNVELTSFEKLMEGVFQTSLVVRKYYESLIESGFTEEEAIELTKEYQKSLLSLGK
jgi:hypothetical protein